MNEKNRTDIKVIFALTMLHFAGDFYSSFVNPLLPVFVEKFGLSLAQVGLIAGITRMLAFVVQNLTNGNIVIGDTIPNFIDTYDYRVGLQPGRYEWVLVAWFPKDLLGVKELGAYYRNPEKQSLPTPIEVLPGVVIQGLNIIADFGNLNRPLPFFRR